MAMLHARAPRSPVTVDFVPIFEQSIVSAVLAHMNDDHPDDSLLIVRAFGRADATAAVMTGLDHLGGTWSYTAGGETGELTVPWSVEISERSEIRREIVGLYDSASTRIATATRYSDQSG
jgi:hypothetical protein